MFCPTGIDRTSSVENYFIVLHGGGPRITLTINKECAKIGPQALLQRHVREQPWSIINIDK